MRAWRAKRHPELVAEQAEPTEAERRQLFAERDVGRLEWWLATARTCADIADLLAVP